MTAQRWHYGAAARVFKSSEKMLSFLLVRGYTNHIQILVVSSDLLLTAVQVRGHFDLARFANTAARDGCSIQRQIVTENHTGFRLHF